MTFSNVAPQKGKEEGWTYKAYIRYAKALFLATLHVAPNGDVTMVDDKSLTEIEEVATVKYESPFRILTVPREDDTVSPPFWLPLICETKILKVIESEIPQDILMIRLFYTGEHGIQKQTAIGTPSRGKVSLRGLKTRVFHHDLEKSWGAGIKLNLNGFEYDHIETVSLNEAKANDNLVELTPEFDKRNRTHIFPQRIDKPAEAHILWLSRQYGCPLEHDNKQKDARGRLIACAIEAEKDEKNGRSIYEPHPFEQLARALRNDGKDEVAKRITLAKLALERKLVYPRSAEIREMLDFDYGLFWGKSIWFFLIALIFGTLSFDFLNYGCFRFPLGSQHSCTSVFEKPVLVTEPVVVRMLAPPDTTAPHAGRNPAEKWNAIMLEGGNKSIVLSVGPGPEMNRTDNISAIQKKEESRKIKSEDELEEPCHHQVESILYAADVFIPLLDLRQEVRCSITMRDDSLWWPILRILKAMYAAFGAIVSSMLVLTVSGALRHYVER